MKFCIEYSDDIEKRVLNYVSDDYSFDMEPFVREVDYGVILNMLTLTVIDYNKIVEVSGFCPYGSWVKTNHSVPAHKRGLLKVIDKLEPGFDYTLNKEEWPTYVNTQTRWVCVGDPGKTENAVEFINNCVAVIGSDGEFIALWLKPQKLPPV